MYASIDWIGPFCVHDVSPMTSLLFFVHLLLLLTVLHDRCVRIKLGDPLGRVLKRDGSLAPFGVRNGNQAKYSSSSSSYAAARGGSANLQETNSTEICCYVDYVRRYMCILLSKFT